MNTSIGWIKKNGGGIVIALLFLGGFVLIARPSTPTTVSTPPTSSYQGAIIGALSAEEGQFDFGSVSMAKGKVLHEFKMKNTTEADITIGKLYTSCMCTTATLEMGGKKFGPYGMPGHGFVPSIGEVIRPGEEATVSAVFDPAAHGPAGVGRIERSIIVENSAGEPVEFGFVAVVTP